MANEGMKLTARHADAYAAKRDGWAESPRYFEYLEDSAHSLPVAICPPLLDKTVNGDGADRHTARGYELPKGTHRQKDEAVLQDPDEQRSEHSPDRGPEAAKQTCATNHRRCEHVELLTPGPYWGNAPDEAKSEDPGHRREYS